MVYIEKSPAVSATSTYDDDNYDDEYEYNCRDDDANDDANRFVRETRRIRTDR